jgi:hypothetical protein
MDFGTMMPTQLLHAQPAQRAKSHRVMLATGPAVHVSRVSTPHQVQRGAQYVQLENTIQTKVLQLSASPVVQATTRSRTSSMVLLHVCRVVRAVSITTAPHRHNACAVGLVGMPH